MTISIPHQPRTIRTSHPAAAPGERVTVNADDAGGVCLWLDGMRGNMLFLDDQARRELAAALLA